MALKKLLLASFLMISIVINGIAQNSKKQVAAVKLLGHIEMDGFLNEDEWQLAQPAGDFVQYDPYNGPPATERTEVRILYDNTAIYFGAMMYDSSPDSILSELGFRDTDDLNSDYISVILSPYNDGLNGFSFGVSSAGMQYDGKMYNDNYDKGWDAVYVTNTQILDSGWSAEIKIPYSALRFPEEEVHTWSINLERSIRRKRELDTWSFIDKMQDGELRQAGELTGLNGISPPLRLSFTPYVSGYLEKPADASRWGYSFNYGMDLKYGINESFTLDMTLIPDFGQVQSDDQIYNLSPFEVYYEEQRPFFTEGTELFDKGNIFYSRRVGDSPVGFDDVYDSVGINETVTENPTKTRLINAAKISGRTSKGLGIGVFNAVSGRTFATITDTVTGITREVETQAASNYNMVVVDQSLKNNSYISFYNTNVYRGKDYYMANVSGTEFQFFNNASTYAVDGKFNLSQKYFPSASPEFGKAWDFTFSKTSGQFRFDITQYVEDDKYDPNDLGFLSANNEITHAVNLNYNFYDPFGRFLWWYNGLTVWHQTLYNPYEFVEFGFAGYSRATFRNRLTLGVDFDIEPVAEHDYYEARTPGQVFIKSPKWEVGGFMSPDYRKALIVDAQAGFEQYQKYGQHSWYMSASPRWRVNDRLTLRLSAELSKDFNDMGYVTDRVLNDQNEIIFGRRDLQTVESILNVTYIFTTKLALDFRMRHYWLVAKYREYYQLQEDGYLSGTDYSDNNDFDFNAFNIDMILRWEFAPGSELAVAWKNAVLSYNESAVTENYFDNLQNTIESPADNSLSVKLLYYLDYLYLKKR